jgi:hypothetical protein
MRIRFERQRAGELDHEILWASVSAASLAGAMIWLRLVGPLPLVCPFHWLTGVPCLTCGSTRALAALAAGDLAASLRFNPAVLPGCLASALYVLYAAVVVGFRLPRVRWTLAPRDVRLARWGIVTAAALLWCFLVIEGV